IEHRQIVCGHGYIRMVRPKDFLFDRQRSLESRFSFPRFALCLIKSCQIVQVHRDIAALRTVVAVEDGERSQVKLLSFLVLTLPTKDRSQRSLIRGRLYVLGTKRALSDLDA